MQYKTKNNDVYIVDGSRSSFLKAKGKPGAFAASDLAVYTGRELLKRQPFGADAIGEVVTGCAMASPDEANIGRLVSLRLGCGDSTPGWTVHRNCASGMQALDSAAKDVALGRHDLVLAGGMDAMSRSPLLFNDKMVNWLAGWYGAKSFLAKLKMASKFKVSYLAPVIALLRGLTDPVCGLNMGQTAENIAHQFNITRAEMDAYAVESHKRLANAFEKGYMGEVEPLYDTKGNVFATDTGLRADSSTEKLARLRPIFDRKFGSVTAGNSSQVTDGAALLILASADAVKKYNLPVLGRIVDTNWAGCSPAFMGLGPVYAATPLLRRNQLSLNDIDYWETNEAFAAQVLGCLKAWESDDFCQKELGLDKAFGTIDHAKLNVDGGAIAIGHPIGASGARIVLHLCHVLKRNKAKYGVANICIGGGQGGAMLIENVDSVEEVQS
jgi:acetyl-CoA C-acetyltransferase